MPRITANGLSLEYDERGRKDDPAILLIMGLGAQMVLWPDMFCDMLADQGFRVIRFDNRDIGLSQKFDGAAVPGVQEIIAGLMAGKPLPVPYLLGDMAADAVGMLDALGIGRAHVVGASMGGMIAQLVAIHHASRVASLTSIMSTSGRYGLPPGKPEAMEKLLTRPAGTDRKSVVDHSVMLAGVIGSPAYPVPEEHLRAFSERTYDRSFYPEGMPRHYAAILSSGGREALLPGVTAPTLVLHGSEDPLLPVEHGHDTARLIPGAALEVIEGMGHNLPPQLNMRLATLIGRHAKAAEA
ncbi:alpha/beta fold hydrolase [Emcibacter sp. SYSU 3D8]|uniref:alpha/beta fold hydrolase n=1 Tax=Emcibacter sp. SYSU 3D8 TaxID=3133969 RepID=UPI0031FF2C31